MLVPAIHFSGNCAEAIALYQSVFRAEVISIAYDRDAPPDSGMIVTNETMNHVMHAELMVTGTRVNMCDVREKVVPDNMILMNVFFESVDDVTRAFHGLRDGGIVLTDLGPQFWTPMYGEIRDRFGVHWQLMADQ